MILKFPNLDTLKLALTSGAVPPTVSQSAATAAFDEENQVWVQTAAPLPRRALTELKRLGVQSSKANGAALTAAVGSWLELVPLRPDPTPHEKPEQTPVLFDLAGAELPGFVNEILRLGNDRQSYRWLDTGDNQGRALLRVFGPPYYSLLRALDRQGKPTAPVAYLERAPRVWIEMGHTHPLADRLHAPEGKLLLLRPPRQWLILDDVPFHDVYEVLDFSLPAPPATFHDAALLNRIRVALSLRAGGTPDGAELWVLRDDAVEELNRFVQNADDQLLNRLRFAVARHEGRDIVVVRLAHSKLPPPVLVLPALGYRPYLKLTNLFVPCGHRLHPPLRRDQVRKLLADDLAHIVWLAPGAAHTFTPETLPEDSFRPLADWVDYVLDRDRVALDAWVQAARFDFETFVCDEDGQPRQKIPPLPEKGRSVRSGPKSSADKRPGTDAQRNKDQEKAAEPTVVEDVLDVVPVEPNEIQLRLQALEEEFLQIEGGLDAAARAKMWPELATLHAALKSFDEAGVCWMNALWSQEPAAADQAARWLRTEAARIPGRSWAVPTLKNAEAGGDDLDRLLATDEPAAAEVRALAAFLVWAARLPTAPAALRARLNPVARFLEKQERLLPIRAAWLAWYHFARLSGDDVLTLAHARDRLLERLFQNGLRPEQDLPSFLRFAGQPSNQRFRAVRQWLGALPDAAKAWSSKTWSLGAIEPTAAYIDLIFAFGLARLGESAAASVLLDEARTALLRKNDVHSLLCRAFEYRIRQALDGKLHRGSLPNELMDELVHLDKMPRYLVERLLERSRILEPDQTIDAYRHWTTRDDPLGKELAELIDIRDRQEVAVRIERLLTDAQAPKRARGHEARARIMRLALDQAPRLGEEFARSVLARVTAVFDSLSDSADLQGRLQQMELLEKGLTVAAHFDRVEHIHPFVDRFGTMLAAQKGDQGIQLIEALAAHCFRGLRKLGMREEIDSLLSQMARVLLGGQDPRALDAANLPAQPTALRALLHVAGGWYYFGRDRQADPVMQKVRGVLFSTDSKLLPKDLSQLACTYAATTGQAPVATAQQRLQELFDKLPPIRDALTTQSHYYLLHLNLVEAVVLAVVSDDFTMGTSARRWLDDDEYLVRKRIHRDLRAFQSAM